jgi:hypothetical protein
MKALKLTVVVVLAVALFSTMSFARASKNAMAGYSHDLRSVYSSASFTLCSFCHVAHKLGSAPVGPGVLLWNHKLSAVATYGVYASPSFDQLNTGITDVGGTTASTWDGNPTFACLSCHDGTVAVNSFYEGVTKADFSGPIPEDTTFMPDGVRVRDLTKTHPVHFNYTTALATAAFLRAPANATSIDGAGEIPLFGGKMECATCHDPHKNSGIMTNAFPTQTSGSFCTYCHL